LNSVHFTDNNTGWAVGGWNSNIILNTTDGGTNWSPQTSGTTWDLRSVYFTDNNTGWAVGRYGTIRNTTDGGTNWNPQTSGATGSLMSVYFTDSNIGWIVGSVGVILNTTNGGTNWNSQTSGSTNHLWSVHFTDNNTGWDVGDEGTILKTTDGGTNWNSQSSGTNNRFYSVHFTDNNTGWAVGEDGTILKTTDGGINWNSQTSGTTEGLRSVYFTENAGWAVGDGGTILNLQNGTSQTSGTTEDLLSVHFVDDNTGWAVGKYGTILKTITGGVIPVELASFTAATSKGKVFLNWSTATELNNLGFEIERKIIHNEGVGEWITIGFREGYGTTTEPKEYSYVDDISNITPSSLAYRLKQIDFDGSYEFSEEVLVENSTKLPKEFNLSQNYPNPFNPSTMIEFSIPKEVQVNLNVFNILGEKIKELKNEIMKPGYYEVEFNASTLASGIYLYRIKAGSFVEIKKMVLQR